LIPAPDRILPGGLRLVSAFEHSGPAKVLVHNLKYQGVSGYPDLVAEALAGRAPRCPLVPVPRALSRRLRYGVDPSHLLARAIGERLGVPVLSLLRSPLHTARRAGGDHARPVGTFRTRVPLDEVVLVDDVVTTGATIRAAADSLGPGMVRLALSANVVSGVSSLRPPGL
jgi:predicted amidophosphoribosyltransferase